MKSLRHCFVFAALCVGLLISFSVQAAEKSDKPGKAPVGSIRPVGKTKSNELPGLAKINFQQAMATALAEVPGNIIKAELEVEDGNLQYSFEIVRPDKAVVEVEIDAGNGKVLDIDKEDGDEKH